MVHVFQAFPFGLSSEAVDSIGFWARYGMPMISNSVARGLLPTSVGLQQNQGTDDGPFALRSTPHTMRRRLHSMPG